MNEKLTNEGCVESRAESESQKLKDVLPAIEKSYFSGDEFTCESFSVDNFVKVHRKRVTLEQLKEDLSAYLNILKQSMIELINEDYTDFVNLSTNLMGLDKSIANLSTPLKQLRDDILSIEQQFNGIINKLDAKISKKNMIRLHKNHMKKVIRLMNGLDMAEKWFYEFKSGSHTDEKTSELFCTIEKIALLNTNNEIEFNSLNDDKFNIPILSEQIKPRLECISNELYKHLELGFFDAIANNNRDQFECIIRIFSLNGKNRDLENLYRNNIVRPYMNEVICESFLVKNGINCIFDKILEFIDLKCELIIGTENKNFSFIINSVWKEVAICLLIQTPSLFSVGNPDIFHFHYTSTLNFIEKFALKSQILKSLLFSDSHYKDLISKFNTKAYFHIRFRQIATKFESSIDENPYERCKENGPNNNNFRFNITLTLYECITTCWSVNTIFISQLFPSFWKLTLQLFSRYAKWLQNLNEFESTNKTNNTTENIQNKYSLQSVVLCLLVNDCEHLITKIKLFFVSDILPLKPYFINNDELQQSFNEALESIETNGLSNVVNLIKIYLISQCDAILRQVNDVPRLYRKTNKDIPTKASNYVTNSIDLITAFISKEETHVWKNSWTEDILSEVTFRFKQFISEVLTSVQKIENSLKRLKKAKSSNQNNQIKGIMSDDDKIRLQIFYDIEEYGRQCEERLNVKKESIKSFNELYEMANAAKNLIN